MAIPQAQLLTYATRYGMQKSAAVVSEAKRAGRQTAFLSHSHKDQNLAKGVQGFLQEHGWDVYIDWEDTSMPETPDRTTAEQIQRKIRDLDWFLFLATQNSMASRWCPWEIGCADGRKPLNTILVLQTVDDGGRHYGHEYMELYRHLSVTTTKKYAVFQPGQSKGGVLLENVAV